MLNLNRKLLCTNCVRCLWGLFPLSIRSHLDWLESSQVATISLILEEDHTRSGVTNSLPSHKHFPSFISSIFSITLCIFVFLCSYFPPLSIRFLSCFYVYFHVHLISALHHQSPYTCSFPLPSRNELSYLVNHFVKFVSSGDLLWVLTI